MLNILDLRTYERDANLRIASALAEIIEEEEELAVSLYVGKLVRFNYIWPSSWPATTTVLAPITGVRLVESLRDSSRYLMFDIDAVDPQTGQKLTIKRSRNTFKFV